MLYLDIKYAKMASLYLESFKVKKPQPFLANFKCPYGCDAKTRKARGYFSTKLHNILFSCHKCGKKQNLAGFLKEHIPSLHDEYLLERLQEYKNNTQQPAPAIVVKAEPVVIQKYSVPFLTKISELYKDHPAVKYVVKRAVPEAQWYRLRYAPKFVSYVNQFRGDGEKLNMKDHPRLVIPMLGADGHLIGFQGRSFDPNESLRYITIMVNHDAPKVFGLEQINNHETISIVEGPLDSLFLNNSLAMAGSDVTTEWLNLPKEQIRFIYDNEPRAPIIIRKIEKRIAEGYKVVLLPPWIQKKDLNDMVLNGLSLNELHAIIDENTYRGMLASLRLSEWRKD